MLRDPFPFVARWPDAGSLPTTDHLANTTNDQGLENHRGIHSAFNIGYMFFRKSALPLVVETRRDHGHPQLALRHLVLIGQAQVDLALLGMLFPLRLACPGLWTIALWVSRSGACLGGSAREHAGYGLRAVRIGEASHLGPRPRPGLRGLGRSVA